MRSRQQLARRVLSFIQERQLIKSGESLCLVHILASLKRTLPLKLHIAHLNHLLRGDESDADADYVNSLSHELGIPASIEKRDVMAYRKQKRLSLEEAAREVRYNFFAEVARSIGTDKVAVGHTIDDQIETILMHLVRGTGLTGLRGM
jgi:tRNA(Ile)-lysidine synthase